MSHGQLGACRSWNRQLFHSGGSEFSTRAPRRNQPCGPLDLDSQTGFLGFPGCASGKEPTCQCREMSETQVRFLGCEDLLEEGMATHSSILAWKIRGTEEPVVVYSLSLIQLFVTPWTGAHQAPLSMGFSRQECWSGWPFLPPGDVPHLVIKSGSPELAGGFFFFFKLS